MTKDTIKKEFEAFLAQCYPCGTGTDQRRQLSNAFYGGAVSILTSVMQAASTLPEHQACGFAQAVLEEGREYLNDAVRRATELANRVAPPKPNPEDS